MVVSSPFPVLLATALAVAPSPAPTPSVSPGPAQDVAIVRLVDDLNRGHLVLEPARFVPGGVGLAPGTDSVLVRVARALNRATGRFVVVVPPEKSRGFAPDTVLSRRRAEEALRRLLGAGSSTERLVGLIQPPTLQEVDPGRARIEIFRIN